jgi:hypothetical protein
MTKSNIPSIPLYIQTKIEDYYVQFILLNTSGSLQIHILMVFSFALYYNKVFPTGTIATKTSKRSGHRGGGYL